MEYQRDTLAYADVKHQRKQVWSVVEEEVSTNRGKVTTQKSSNAYTLELSNLLSKSNPVNKSQDLSGLSFGEDDYSRNNRSCQQLKKDRQNV